MLTSDYGRRVRGRDRVRVGVRVRIRVRPLEKRISPTAEYASA